MIRTRHYHLGCGESLFTHYMKLWNATRDNREQVRLLMQREEQQQIKKVQVKN